MQPLATAPHWPSSEHSRDGPPAYPVWHTPAAALPADVSGHSAFSNVADEHRSANTNRVSTFCDILFNTYQCTSQRLPTSCRPYGSRAQASQMYRPGTCQSPQPSQHSSAARCQPSPRQLQGTWCECKGWMSPNKCRPKSSCGAVRPASRQRTCRERRSSSNRTAATRRCPRQPHCSADECRFQSPLPMSRSSCTRASGESRTQSPQRTIQMQPSRASSKATQCCSQFQQGTSTLQAQDISMDSYKNSNTHARRRQRSAAMSRPPSTSATRCHSSPPCTSPTQSRRQASPANRRRLPSAQRTASACTDSKPSPTAPGSSKRASATPRIRQSTCPWQSGRPVPTATTTAAHRSQWRRT